MSNPTVPVKPFSMHGTHKIKGLLNQMKPITAKLAKDNLTPEEKKQLIMQLENLQTEIDNTEENIPDFAGGKAKRHSKKSSKIGGAKRHSKRASKKGSKKSSKRSSKRASKKGGAKRRSKKGSKKH